MYEMMIRHLDNQNRFTLPKKIREMWEKRTSKKGCVIIYPVEGAVYLTTAEDEKHLKKVLAAGKAPRSVEAPSGCSLECELDLRGRIKMPRALMPLIPFPGKDLWVFLYGTVLKVVDQNLSSTCVRRPDATETGRAEQYGAFRKKIRTRHGRSGKFDEGAERISP